MGEADSVPGSWLRSPSSRPERLVAWHESVRAFEVGRLVSWSGGLNTRSQATVDGDVAIPAAVSELDLKHSLHPAPQYKSHCYWHDIAGIAASDA